MERVAGCAIVIGAVLAGIAYSGDSIRAATEPPESSCLNKGKQIGLAMLNYENSKKRFPLIDQQIENQPQVARC